MTKGRVSLVVDQLLEQRGMTIYQLARQSGLPYATCHRLVRHPPSRIDMSTLAALCTALKCVPSDLLAYESPQQSE